MSAFDNHRVCARYFWIPFIGDFLGGVFGGLFYMCAPPDALRVTAYHVEKFDAPRLILR